jgi:hypothetical protein
MNVSRRNQLLTQNDLLLNKLLEFYKTYDVNGVYNPNNNLDKMLRIITGGEDDKKKNDMSLRLIDWFVTNYAKHNFTVIKDDHDTTRRFKVYEQYKLMLKAYSKKRFDPFCRWERIQIPYVDDKFIETTIGQLNFFKWAIENKVIEYVEEKDNRIQILHDMNERNSTSSNKQRDNAKTRKKRKELSVSATKSIKKEHVEIILKFN